MFASVPEKNFENDCADWEEVAAILDDLERRDGNNQAVVPRSPKSKTAPIDWFSVRERLRDRDYDHPDVVRALASLEVGSRWRVNFPKKRQRSDSSSRQHLHILKGFEASKRPKIVRKAVPAVSKPTPHSLPASSTVSQSLSPSPSKGQGQEGLTLQERVNRLKEARTEKARRAPRWRDTTDIVKLPVFFRVLEAKGALASFSLNLTDEILKAAMAHPKGVKAYLFERLQRNVRKALGGDREVVLVVEVSPSGRLHCHGLTNADHNELERLHRALATTGGKNWSHPSPRQQQVHVRAEQHPDAWARYLVKAFATTRRTLNIDSCVATNQNVRRAGAAYWEAERLRYAQSGENNFGDKRTLIPQSGKPCGARVCESEVPDKISKCLFTKGFPTSAPSCVAIQSSATDESLVTQTGLTNGKRHLHSGHRLQHAARRGFEHAPDHGPRLA